MPASGDLPPLTLSVPVRLARAHNAVVELDRLCSECHGSGTLTEEIPTVVDEYGRATLADPARAGNYRWRARSGAEVEFEVLRDTECADCRGHGRVPTEAGRAILHLVKRYAQ